MTSMIENTENTLANLLQQVQAQSARKQDIIANTGALQVATAMAPDEKNYTS